MYFCSVMEQLIAHSAKLIAETELVFVRYLYEKINWNNRLIGLVGPRGVGKTTLILQHIKSKLPHHQTLYVTAEDFYFSTNKLIDLATTFVQLGGKYLFIDEIHKYPNWSKELKLIYDYHSELHIVFTGSSVLDIKKGSSDLSRRSVVYQMQGLSFREYLAIFHSIELPTYSLDDVLNHRVDFSVVKHPLLYFSDYLKNGYYPFAREEDFDVKLKQIINQTLEVDIPFFSNMNVATGRKLKQLLAIVSESVPFKPNMSKLAEMIGVSRNNMTDYLYFLEEAGMIIQLKTDTGGIRNLGKVDKIYLDNSNLIYSLVGNKLNIGNVRETFFINQLKCIAPVNSSSLVDFTVNNLEFEIGGKKKSAKQLQSHQHGYVVKDEIETGFASVIPLWHFGMLY